VIEWLVWWSIVGHSDRTTHVFLLLDGWGVDGIVRRVRRRGDARRSGQLKVESFPLD
jgi:hypothetical protein